MLRTASSLPLAGLLTLGFDPTRFQMKPPACYRATWQLPEPDSHRQATTSLRTANHLHRQPPVPLDARKIEARPHGVTPHVRLANPTDSPPRLSDASCDTSVTITRAAGNNEMCSPARGKPGSRLVSAIEGMRGHDNPTCVSQLAENSSRPGGRQISAECASRGKLRSRAWLR